MRRLLAALFVLVSAPAFAQQTVNITATDSSTGSRVQLADSVARTIRVTIKDASGNPFGTSGNPIRVDPTGTTTQPLAGTKTNNNVAPGTTNLGVLPVLANASPPAWTEGNQVTLSSDLAGNLRVNVMNGSNTVTDAATQTTGATTVATVEAYQLGYNGSVYTRIFADPCQANAKVYLPFTQATSTQIITGTASKKIYLCSFSIVAAAAENVSVVSGTGSVCATNTVADIGATTAANGLNFGANGGAVIGTGASSIAATTVNADNMCILQAGSVRISGVITYVVQ